jgi:hypothetical protein
VTFTVVATNYGPDPVDLWVNAGQVFDGLSYVASATCEPPTGADGTQCEYSFLTYPGQTITTTLVAQVQATSGQYASDAACVRGAGYGTINGLINDPNPGNDCKIATVQVIPAGPPPPPSTSSPINQTVPNIVGVPVVGNPLIETNGGWTNTPTSFRYQWLRCNNVGGACIAIGGATGQIYTLSWADLGHTIRVQEWATNGSGTEGPADSIVTNVVTAPPAPGAPGAPPIPPAGSAPVPVAGSPPPVPPSVTRDQIKAQLLKQLVPSGKCAGIGSLLRKRGYTFWLKALDAGRVVIDWYYVPAGPRLSRVMLTPVLFATGSAAPFRAGRVRLTIRLTPAGSRILKASERIKLTAEGTYAPTGSSPVTVSRTFTLHR